MFALAILCVIMAAISMGFWILEGIEAYQYILSLVGENAPKTPQGINPFTYICYAFAIIAHGFKILKIIPMSIPLIVDLTCTLTLTTIFNLGGVLGTLMGLSASNILSLVLNWKTITGRKRSK